MKRRLKRYFVLLFVILVTVLMVFAFVKRAKPYLISLAEMQGKRLGSSAINQAVIDVFANDDIKYGDVSQIKRSDDGSVISIHADIAALNELRNEVSDAIGERIDSSDSATVKLSLGNMISEVFSGRGISIKVKLDAVSTVDVDFQSEFISAGINQTLHRIKMTVIVNYTVLVGLYKVETSSTSDFNLAETVIVGSVPQNVW